MHCTILCSTISSMVFHVGNKTRDRRLNGRQKHLKQAASYLKTIGILDELFTHFDESLY